MKRNIIDIRKSANWIWDVLIIFCFLFQFRVGFGLTTTRMAVLYAIFYLLCHNRYVNKFMANRFFMLSGIMLAVVFVQIFMNYQFMDLEFLNRQDNILLIYPRYIVYVVLYVYVVAMYYTKRFKTVENFGKAYLGAIFIQIIAIYLAAMSENVRVFLFTNTVTDHNTEDMLEAVKMGSRICGIGMMAAGGSLVLATGCMLLLFLVVQGKLSNKCFLISYGLIAGATMLIGRTGFYFEVIMLLVYLVLYKNPNKYIGVVALVMLCAGGLVVFSLNTGMDWMLSYYKKWIGEILNPDMFYNTFKGILGHGQTKYNTFSKNAWIGSNILRGNMPQGGQMVADSGYLRMFNSIGIIGCVMYYGSFLYTFVYLYKRIRERNIKIIYALFILFSFIIEFKEPFMMKYFFRHLL